MTATTTNNEPATRELELELALWEARSVGIQHAANAINAQAQLLNVEKREVDTNLARCREALEARRAALKAAIAAAKAVERPKDIEEPKEIGAKAPEEPVTA